MLRKIIISLAVFTVVCPTASAVMTATYNGKVSGTTGGGEFEFIF